MHLLLGKLKTRLTGLTKLKKFAPFTVRKKLAEGLFNSILSSSFLGRDSRNNRIMIPNVKLRLTQRSFTVRGAESWNLLPLNVQKSLNLGQFKKLSKAWILANIPRFLE